MSHEIEQPTVGTLPTGMSDTSHEQQSSILWVAALPVLIAIFLAAIAVVGSALV